MDVEHLIECVKNHVFLYDLGHKDYKNTSRKAAIWEQIAAELNENSKYCFFVMFCKDALTQAVVVWPAGWRMTREYRVDASDRDRWTRCRLIYNLLCITEGTTNFVPTSFWDLYGGALFLILKFFSNTRFYIYYLTLFIKER